MSDIKYAAMDCKKCGERFEFSPRLAGKTDQCPHCYHAQALWVEYDRKVVKSEPKTELPQAQSATKDTEIISLLSKIERNTSTCKMWLGVIGWPVLAMAVASLVEGCS